MINFITSLVTLVDQHLSTCFVIAIFFFIVLDKIIDAITKWFEIYAGTYQDGIQVEENNVVEENKDGDKA